jgi:hypothetical protein
VLGGLHFETTETVSRLRQALQHPERSSRGHVHRAAAGHVGSKSIFKFPDQPGYAFFEQ